MLCRTLSQLCLGIFVATIGCALGTKVVVAQSSASGYTKSLLNQQARGTKASYFSSENITARNQASLRPRAGVPGINRSTLPDFGASARTKPFTGVARGPTVSPYLALDRPFGSSTDYHTIVRPLAEQQRQQQQQQRINIQNQRRLNQVAARAPFNTRGDENAAPTGHSAVFQSLGSYQNTGGYFPAPSRPKQR